MKAYYLWALLSALFAGLTAILAKKGIESVPSNLAMAVRVAVVLVLAAAVAIASKQTKLAEIDGKAWVFLCLSGLATGASWLCYFKALALGPVSAVAPIDKLSFVIAMILGILIFKEQLTWNIGVGGALILVGVLVTVMK